MSNSAWPDLSSQGKILNLHVKCPNPKCRCQKITTFTPHQFMLEGGSIKSNVISFQIQFLNKMDDDLKRRSKCKNEKELFEFNIRKDTLKYRNQCRDCIKLIQKEYQSNNKDKKPL